MPYRSSISGSQSVKRTQTMQQVAAELEISDKGRGLKQLFDRLRVRHHLRSSLRGKSRYFNADEADQAYSEHLRFCGDSPICFPERFATEPKKTPNVTTQVNRYFKDNGQFLGTIEGLAKAIGLPEPQTRQALNKNIAAGRIEVIKGGWCKAPPKKK